MGGLAQIVMDALDPLVGSTAASTCVRATALSIGKTSDSLTLDDLPALEQNIRKLLGPVAPAPMVNQLITDIEGRVR